MTVDINLELLAKKNLTPNMYSILWCIARGHPIIWLDDSREHTKYLTSILDRLESEMWIKRLDEGKIELRKKSLELKLDGIEDVSFTEFWDKYHEIVKEWKKTDKAAAEKKWNRLSKKDKKSAFDNIQLYYDNVPINSNGRKFPVKARSYLENRNFEDEFDINTEKKTASSKFNKML